MKLVYEPAALKAMGRMPAHDREALKIKLKRYAETGAGDVMKLASRDEWRLRHGSWRAIFIIENGIVVIRIAHRRQVYR